MNGIGFIGVGKMGRAMIRKLAKAGFEVVAFDFDAKKLKEAEALGAIKADSMSGLAKQLRKPKIIWLMLPEGVFIDELIFGKHNLVKLLSKGDVIIDGGNSNFRDSMRRAGALKKRGVYFLDIGVSGGVKGPQNGLCMMIGGERCAYEICEGHFESLSKPNGAYKYFGKSGAGHFIKMAHNAIEYGILQVLGEGFWLLKESEFRPNLKDVASLWNKGSIVRSYLLEALENVFSNKKAFDKISGYIGGGSTGRWALSEAKRLRVSMPLIKSAYLERVRSHNNKDFFSDRVVAALRHEFGGHRIVKRET